MRGNDGKRDRTRRGELQRMLGDLGVIPARQAHGTPERPASGWYAELADGTVVYLGDYSTLAAMKIRELIAQVAHA